MLVNAQASPAQLAVNDATGGWFAPPTVTVRAAVLVAPLLSVTVSVTL